MPKYLLEVKYTLDGIRGVKSEGGSARVAAATEVIEGIGGKVESFYFAFGDTDVYLVADCPRQRLGCGSGAGCERGRGGHGAVRRAPHASRSGCRRGQEDHVPSAWELIRASIRQAPGSAETPLLTLQSSGGPSSDALSLSGIRVNNGSTVVSS